MSNQDVRFINENEFDTMLMESIPEIPPEDIVSDVTPWRQAMDRVLAGIAMTTITFNFFCLNYILPAIGMIAILLGFRALQRENKWFRYCYFITILRAIYLFSYLIWNATILQNTINMSKISVLLSNTNFVLVLLQFVCFWQAIKEVQMKAKMEPRAQSAGVLIVWYILIFVCGYIKIDGMIIVGGLLIAYFSIIRSLGQLSKELDEAGYVIQTADVRYNDSMIVKGIVSVLMVGILCGYLFFDSYPMNWTVKDEKEYSGLEETKEYLLNLGFPEDVLSDLETEDILSCEDAIQVLVEMNEYPLNNGREVEEKYLEERWITTVYDVKELKITDIAVQLEDKKNWIILHHFLWQEEPEYLGFSGFFGTESIQLWPVYNNHSEGWSKAGDVKGRLLYDRDDTSYTAPYYYLGEKKYTYNDAFFGMQTKNDIYAAFSLPRDGELKRGYLLYQIKSIEEGWITDSWFNYTHQQSKFQYPVMTAMEKRMNNGWNNAGAFQTIQNAFQFYITDEGIERVGE